MIRVFPCAAAVILPILKARLTPDLLPDDGRTVESLSSTGQCFEMRDDAGQLVGGYVLEAFGNDLWITAAGGQADVDLTKILDAVAKVQGREFDALVYRTKRAGLARKGMAMGYQCTMRKKLK